MKVFVCGSIGYGGIEEIKRVQEILRKRGFEVLDQLLYNYTHIEDFRDKRELCSEIVRRDLDFCREADVIVLIAKNPSFGAMAEVVVSSLKGKPVVVFCPERLKSPWPVYFSEVVVKSEEELIEALKSIESKEIRTIPNVYRDHEMVLTYENFTCICPVTGERDYAVIKIRYKPRDKLIEYESLDNYFKGFKDKAMHHEAVVEKIFNDISKAVNPKNLEVLAEFERRSGVKAIVKMSNY